MTQIQLDAVLREHAAWLAAATAQRLQLPVSTAPPYEPIVAQPTQETFADQGFASPMPPSVFGDPVVFPDVGRADLCGARIADLDFRGADLRYARLMGARIFNPDLGGVDLRWANLEFAGITGATQSVARGRGTAHGADMRGILVYASDFSTWDFSDAKFRFADMDNVNFSGASLSSVDLSGAVLRNVDLEDAQFSNADLRWATLNIKPGHLPQVESLRDVRNLTSLQSFGGAEATLAELRDRLSEKKLSVPAAEINYALNNKANAHEAEQRSDRSYWFQDTLNWLLFDVTYAYGLKPERLLLIGIGVALVLSLFYAFSITRTGGNRDGIWISRPRRPDRVKGDVPAVRLARHNCNPYLTGLWFSVLSAFRIGWGNVSVGEWIARILPNNYELQATGWPRTLAGLQSLLSVYLLALAISKYLL